MRVLSSTSQLLQTHDLELEALLAEAACTRDLAVEHAARALLGAVDSFPEGSPALRELASFVLGCGGDAVGPEQAGRVRAWAGVAAAGRGGTK